jgi:hypothetical protein
VAFLALASIVIVRLVRVVARTTPQDVTASWAALSIGSLLLFPLTWHHHYVLALLPFSYFAFRSHDAGDPRRRAFWIALALLALLRYPGVLHPLKPIASVLAVFLL